MTKKKKSKKKKEKKEIKKKFKKEVKKKPNKKEKKEFKTPKLKKEKKMSEKKPKSTIKCISKKGFILNLHHETDCQPAGHCFCSVVKDEKGLRRVPKSIHVIANVPFVIPVSTFNNHKLIRKLRYAGKIIISK
jgi:hypothetical protein